MINKDIIKEIRPAAIEDADEVAALGKEIWNEHYLPILGKKQIDYMINKYQSCRAVKEQMTNEKYRYFFIVYGDTKAGYVGIQNNDGLYLSKLYILKDFRKKGLAKFSFNFLKDLCRKENIDKIWLTVNKNNYPAIETYKALGMTLTREEKADIGEGFFMDDYIFEYYL